MSAIICYFESVITENDGSIGILLKKLKQIMLDLYKLYSLQLSDNSVPSPLFIHYIQAFYSKVHYEHNNCSSLKCIAYHVIFHMCSELFSLIIISGRKRWVRCTEVGHVQVMGMPSGELVPSTSHPIAFKYKVK